MRPAAHDGRLTYGQLNPAQNKAWRLTVARRLKQLSVVFSRGYPLDTDGLW